MIRPWKRIRSQPARSFRVFSIRTDTTISPRTGRKHDFYILESRDWINVIPLSDNQQVVMIKQYRHGSRKVTLEIPGGLVDAGDTPKKAAARELLEETGYQAKKWQKIGVVNPNPALFNNRCYTFLAEDIKRVTDPSPDQTEDIEVILIPLKRIPRLILNGEIDHAMVITAFTHYFLRYPDGLSKV
jgi:ADP-ribose pyrophosphatase